MRQSASFRCSTVSVAHSSPKLSHANTSTGRAPSMDHIAISMAPVSDAGTMAILKSAGTPSSLRVRSIASLSLALAALDRCDRPTNAPSRARSVQPGRFLVGPDENRASVGRTPGSGTRVIFALPSLQMSVRRWERIARCEEYRLASICQPICQLGCDVIRYWVTQSASRELR